MGIKVTIPNTSSDYVTFGSANTTTAAQIAGIDSGSTNGQMAFYTTASGTSTERMRIDSSGNFLINISSNVSGVGTSGAGRVLSKASASTNANNFLAYASANDAVITMGHDGSLGTIATTYAASAGYTPLTFNTGGAERMRIDSSGNVLVTGGGGLGYGTGSGGTVTQATSKSTAVTLNKPTGQITMNGAALAAGASVVFVFNNSLMAAPDTLILTTSNLGGNYRVEPYGMSVGGVGIRVTNISGGSLSDALIINFSLIKGATA